MMMLALMMFTFFYFTMQISWKFHGYFETRLTVGKNNFERSREAHKFRKVQKSGRVDIILLDAYNKTIIVLLILNLSNKIPITHHRHQCVFVRKCFMEKRETCGLLAIISKRLNYVNERTNDDVVVDQDI